MNIPQLPLALRPSPEQRLDSFIAAPAGLLPQLQALAAGTDSAWVYVSGGSGQGKTHLALATCAAAGQASRRAAYVAMAAARGRLRAMLEGQEHHALVALDGIEAIAGHRDDEVALFDFHNRARSTGAALLYTARAGHDALGIELPDLRSRLSQCIRFALPPLDDEVRATILRDRAQRRGLVLDPAAIDWLLTHTGRELDHLIAILDRLDRASLAAQRRITVPFLRQVLGRAGA